jgi:hypothetical protein
LTSVLDGEDIVNAYSSRETYHETPYTNIWKKMT